MPEESSRPAEGESEGLIEHVFRETPQVSSYLVGFAVGDFGVIHLPRDAGPVPMALYAQRGKEELGRFALEIAAYSLAYFEEFFDQKFPLPKLDLVVPPAFPIGGMENWGIIMLTNRVLIDENASLQKKQGVAKLVSHEVSHMWFGDLVTPSWWDDLWLKEGFASWVNLLPLDAKYPGWRVWDRWALNLLYGSGGKSGALEIDQYQATHAVEVPVNHPSEVQEIFDALSYNKGSAMVNMLYHSLGHDTFRKGISAWLEKYKYSNCTTKDLWASLAEESGQPIEQMMTTWTRQMGFPVLEVRRDASGVAWEVSQRRFMLRSDDTHEPEAKKAKQGIWTVPITVLHEGRPVSEKLMLTDVQTTVQLCGQWVKLNVGVRAPLRVYNSPELLEALAVEAATGERFGPLDRVGLVDDCFALLRAGLHTPKQMLFLLQSLLVAEKDPIVWSGVLSVLLRLVEVFSDGAPSLSAFIVGLVAPQKKRLSWEPPSIGETDDDTMLRPTLLSLLGACGDQELGKEAARYCEAYLCSTHDLQRAPRNATSSRVNLIAAFSSACPACGGLDVPQAGVRGIALQVGLSNESGLWGKFCQRHSAAKDAEERDQLLMALMGHGDREALDPWVANAIGGALPSQEWATMFEGLAHNRHHKRLAWSSLVRHWEAVYGMWGQSQFKMKSIVSSAMTGADEKEVEAFFAEHPCDVAKRTVQQGREGLAADAALLKHAAEVEAFLASRSLPESTS